MIRAVLWLPSAFVLLVLTSIATGQEPAHPLKPPDRSSPRATLRSFLDSADALARFGAEEYFPSPTREEFFRFASLMQGPLEYLDLSNVAPSARAKVGRAAAIALYETLSRIDLPPGTRSPGPMKRTGLPTRSSCSGSSPTRRSPSFV